MPCWFFGKKDLKHTPSYRDGIDPDTETRYRREGARFILDTGSKMGLRYETSSTGVVYFHRFYMFHSFREFHRFVTAACCLFMAGKVEETPKKCKDIIKWTKQMLTDAQFQVFGDEPKEEIMTMERILLQTIKFDLMIEHPYSNLLKFAKVLKGDKAKTQSMVQMAWTFINDSLCTTLCLQWESDIIAVALMYLASRLSKIDFADWQGKQQGFKGKWYEALVEDITVDLIEDICHQVLDLYSSQNKQKEESPPPPPPPPKPTVGSGGHTPSGSKRTRTATPEGGAQAGPPAKSSRKDGHHRQSHSPSPAGRGESSERDRHGSRSKSGSKNTSPKHHGHHPSNPPPGPPGSAPQPPLPGPGKNQPQDGSGAPGFSQYNPYMSSQMYTSSFMSQEGSQNIKHLLGGGPAPPAAGSAQGAPAGNYGYPPGATATQSSGYRPPPTSNYPAPPGGSSYTQPPPAGGSYSQPGAAGYQQGSQGHYGQQGKYSQPSAQGQGPGAYGQYQSQPGYQANYSQPPPGYSQPGQGPPGSYPAPNTAQPPPGYNQQQYGGSAGYSGAAGYGGQGPGPSASAGSGQYGGQGYAGQQSNAARAPYPNQQGNIPRQPYPNQGNVPRPGYPNQQGNYQNYQQPPPNAPMRPGMRPPPRGGPPHPGGFPPRPGGPPGPRGAAPLPRGPGQMPPRHGQSGNLTSVPIAGRPGGRYPHH